MGSSWIRDQTSVPCFGRRILNHWATREAPWAYSLPLCQPLSLPGQAFNAMPGTEQSFRCLLPSSPLDSQCPGSCKGLFHHFSSGIARPKDFLMTRCIHSCPQIIWTNGSPSMVSGSTASALPDNVLETQSPEPHPRPSQAYWIWHSGGAGSNLCLNKTSIYVHQPENHCRSAPSSSP